MSSKITVYTKYPSHNDFGGSLDVNKFSIEKLSFSSDSRRIFIEFEGKSGSINSARIYLEPNIAIPLARGILSIAEGHLSKSECTVT